jgi:quercetin dioxygenase-like cupin family protein
MRTIRVVGIVTPLVASGLTRHQPHGQPSGVNRIELQRHDLSTPGREVVQVRVELAPGISFPRHTHPGEEIVFVLEGSLEYQVGNNLPVTLTSGEVLFIPAGAVHSARNGGNQSGAELATYIVEKGKPILSSLGPDAKNSIAVTDLAPTTAERAR